MQHLKTKLFLSILLFVFSTQLFAVPASPYPLVYRQKDGSSISIVLKGDEKMKWAETLDGYSVLLNKEGVYEYAVENMQGDMIPSGVKATDADKRSKKEIAYLRTLPKGVRYSEAQAQILRQLWQINKVVKQGVSSEHKMKTEGLKVRKIPIILIAYSDLAFTYSKSNFDNLINQPDYTLNGATGSVYDYFKDNSFGTLSFTADVFGPYTLSEKRAFYGGNTAGGDDKNPQSMVEEAVAKAADDACNFADYDLDDDGWIDGLHVIFAGQGEEMSGEADAIWSHAWALNRKVTYNGKFIEEYSCSPELGYGSDITAIGVIVHEMSHVLGLPDLYDTDYESQGLSVDLGAWDVMAGGSWNNEGKTPPLHNVWSRAFLGWQEKVLLNEGDNVILHPSSLETKAYMYATKTPKENFWVENRGVGKWERGAPGKGLIIYHVDENHIRWGSNCINCTPSKRGFYIKQADGGDKSTEEHGPGTPFPGTSNNTAFTDTSSPKSLSWKKANTEKPITNIRLVGDDIVFVFNGGAPFSSDTMLDIEMVDIVRPAEGGLLKMCPLEVSLKNRGKHRATDIILQCELNGVEVLRDTLAVLDTAEIRNYVFREELNLFAPKEYVIKVSCMAVGDTNPLNNSCTKTVVSTGQDVQMLSLLSPMGKQPFSKQEKVVYELKNKGAFPIETAYITLNINDVFYYDTLGELPLGITKYTLPHTVDMSATNKDYNLCLYVVLEKDIDASNDTLREVFPALVGIEKEDDENMFRVYPNPAKEYLYLKSSHFIESVELIDMRGYIEKISGSFAKEQMVNIQMYPKGTYILRCRLNTGKMVNRSVILL